MSLQVWLPLNNNLNNQGLTDWNPSIQNNTTATYVNGKIGKALNTGGIIMPANIASQVLNNSEFSYACWLYVNGATDSTTERAMIFGNNSPRRFSMFQYPSANDFHWSWYDMKNGTDTFLCGSALYDVLPSNQWTHIAVTYKNPNGKIYINGELKTTFTGNYTGGDFNYDTQLIHNSPYHYLNDVRLYDHALSPKEVKQISQGLILHYKLSGIGGENIMPNSKTMSLGSANASTGTWRLAGSNSMTRTRVAIDNSPIGSCYGFQNVGIQTPNDGSCYGIDNFPFEANTEYTISMWARIVSGTEGYAGFAIAGATFGDGSYSKFEKNYYVTSLSSEGKWIKCWLNFTTNSNTNRNIYIGVTTGDTDVTTQMCGIKIEKGTIVTPWIPNSSDVEYEMLGLNDGIEYDCSGFGYNGTKTNITINEDTPRYLISSYFEDGSKIQTNFNIPIGTGDFTVSVWVKMPLSTSKTYQPIFTTKGTGAASKGFGLYYNHNQNKFLWSTADGSSATEIWMSETISIYDTWTHVVMVRNSNDAKKGYFYINGIRKELTGVPVIRNIDGHTGNLCIGSMPSDHNPYRYIGALSDFRIYTTALSSDDILTLYNTAATIDNQGNLFTYEVVEG